MRNHPRNRSVQPPAAQQHEASNFTLAVAMAAIAAFFIAGIASVFIYSKNSTLVQRAEAPKAPLTAPAETTGSGGAGTK
jgi:hypothetical protein